MQEEARTAPPATPNLRPPPAPLLPLHVRAPRLLGSRPARLAPAPLQARRKEEELEQRIKQEKELAAEKNWRFAYDSYMLRVYEAQVLRPILTTPYPIFRSP